MFHLETERLILRPWENKDIAPFAEVCADPKVMEFFGYVATREETEALVARFRSQFAKHGFGFAAVDLKATGEFIGFIGLNVPLWEAHFTPCVEVGWRLAQRHWGKGYAPEGAQASLAYAWETLKLKEVVALTAVPNSKSRRVMEKIGMVYDPQGDFDHPRVDAGNPMRRQVLYRIKNVTA